TGILRTVHASTRSLRARLSTNEGACALPRPANLKPFVLRLAQDERNLPPFVVSGPQGQSNHERKPGDTFKPFALSARSELVEERAVEGWTGILRTVHASTRSLRVRLSTNEGACALPRPANLKPFVLRLAQDERNLPPFVVSGPQGQSNHERKPGDTFRPFALSARSELVEERAVEGWTGILRADPGPARCVGVRPS